ncbi:MAG: hypothetical protein NTU49_00515 [Gammaproteobacteria bacterium]|nr:hypothetical protein [Gammaproteobacteria bacterium]
MGFDITKCHRKEDKYFFTDNAVTNEKFWLGNYEGERPTGTDLEGLQRHNDQVDEKPGIPDHTEALVGINTECYAFLGIQRNSLFDRIALLYAHQKIIEKNKINLPLVIMPIKVARQEYTREAQIKDIISLLFSSAQISEKIEIATYSFLRGAKIELSEDEEKQILSVLDNNNAHSPTTVFFRAAQAGFYSLANLLLKKYSDINPRVHSLASKEYSFFYFTVDEQIDLLEKVLPSTTIHEARIQGSSGQTVFELALKMEKLGSIHCFLKHMMSASVTESIVFLVARKATHIK